jgi:CBS domain containing-hemolysin-like protein
VTRETGQALPVKQYDTFAGFVFSLLGHIPAGGQQAERDPGTPAGRGAGKPGCR